MQLVMAGNDSQGLRYGTIETPDYHPKTDNKAQQYLPQHHCQQATSPLVHWTAPYYVY